MDPADKPREVGLVFIGCHLLNFPIPSADHKSRIWQHHGSRGQATGGRLGFYREPPIKLPHPAADHKSRISQHHGPRGQAAEGRL